MVTFIFGRLPEGLPLALVLPALAFAGAGGGQNLVQSNWIRSSWSASWPSPSSPSR
jgi:hypothetical protein